MSNDIITFTPNEKKVIDVLSKIEEEKGRELGEIIIRAYKPHPAKEDLQKLQTWLDENPGIWPFVFDMAGVIEQNLIKRMIPERAAQLALQKNADEIRHDLGYEEATQMEMTLIDNIVLSWLLCQWAEYQLIKLMGQNGIRISVIEFWDRRLNAAQGRYLRACETLAKIRKLSMRNPTLQVNIATQSGQQVNIAGDVTKK
jgi:hypothetical protein